MATAVEPSSAPSAPGKLLSLPIASLIGAIYVLAALAVVFYAVPVVWADYVGSTDSSGNLLMARVAVQIAAIVALVWFGVKLAGDAPPKGVRGGVFLMIASAAVIFFVARFFAMAVDGVPGQIVGAAVGAGLLFLAVRFFTGRIGERWMVAMEEQGWFSSASYKPSLGVRVRRLTILGILLVGGSGVYSMHNHGVLPDRWTLSMPFDLDPITVVRDAKFVIPIVLLLATIWVAFRAVNVPDFAEFLIATEAEMNKVSWSTRKRLFQDTVVVLLTTLIMTVFLLVVDLFWGWLLSRSTVGVLPSRSTSPEKGAQVKEAKW
ncbi:preprotein translocase subunit SecE [Frigoriglobus tundricola]|uniref:Protein translocase subunit SecE n=1 Tax=Frigoriglobus tundricola TaxID=2774151 RepID=A0A6M5Z1K9_9BACT|nr:preprotein translocase subunit SecE [Frigoriglobus tundricola]QJW99636.1 Protein translocase subunit SecE [Frigoriglobus tundricola]